MKSFERSGARWVERRTRPQPPEDTAHPANMYIRVRWRRGVQRACWLAQSGLPLRQAYRTTWYSLGHKER